MARKPIPGWNEAEVDGWLREFRGTAHQCLNALMPHLSGAEQNRAKARINYKIRKMKAEGLDFSVSRAPATATLNIVELHPKPIPQPRPKRPAFAPAPPPTSTPVEGAPVVSVNVEDVASLSRLDALAWTINQAATKAREMPVDKSAASYLKIIAESHAELDQLRKSDICDGMSLGQLLETLPRIAQDLPNDFVEAMVKEYLRRNPKHQIGLKARAM